MNTSATHPINSAKRKMIQGQPAVGVSCGMGSPLIAELLSHAGFDFVLVDLQHGAWTDETVAHAFRAIDLGASVPMARVAANDYGAIGRLLDRGALGIVVPMVKSSQEAQAAAFSVRYHTRRRRI